jgi:hypothetical protein
MEEYSEESSTDSDSVTMLSTTVLFVILLLMLRAVRIRLRYVNYWDQREHLMGCLVLRVE